MIQKSLLSILLLSTLLFADTLIEEHGTVTHIADGDTIDVSIDGKIKRVRFIGIQTLEISDDNRINECYADEATQELTEILGGEGSNVVLRAKFSDSLNHGRLFRHVFITKGNKEIDVSEKLLQDGVALFFPKQPETTYDNKYANASLKAKKQQIGIWSKNNHCQTNTDSENTSFKIFIHYDADGEDSKNLHDEWVSVQNTSNRTVDISGWILSDKANEQFYFPPGTILSNNETITIIGGKGNKNGNTFYWGNDHTIFDNYSDGIYLFDNLYDRPSSDGYYPRGNLKSSIQYPCFSNCSDPLQGKISLKVNYDAPGYDSENPNGEWVKIKNTSSADINLKHYFVHSYPKGSNSYVFKKDTILHPNEVLTLHIGKGSDSRLVKYWGNDTAILNNKKDRIWISTYTRILIDEYSWPKSTNNIVGKYFPKNIIPLITYLYL
jgi:micrococcal nuclease